MQKIFALISIGLMFQVGYAQQRMGGPPPEAFTACQGKQGGSDCGFEAPHGPIKGNCRKMREPELVCVPSGAPDPGGMRRQGRSMPGQPMRRQPMEPMSNDSRGGPMNGLRPRPASIESSYLNAQPTMSRVPDTGQGGCFSNTGLISCPKPGEAFYGQDAHYQGAKPNYRDNGDGTITDQVTGLTWQQAHNEQRIGWQQAKSACDSLQLGGRGDWRLPSIDELFSIADFSGATGLRPFINPLFEIREPDASILRNDRFASTHHTSMMGQTWSSTIYAGNHWDRPGVDAAFFFNFLDGRIKQAPLEGKMGLFYRCVSGAPWGGNKFRDNGDGTVTDQAMGLTWQQSDDGHTRNWQHALSYCENLNLAGKSDWRLPNVKELQSLLDYRFHAPALDKSIFQQRNNNGWFWSSTTHGENPGHAAYVCFGKCISVDGVDVHGAGAQRSDPKTGDASRYRSGMGGQKDRVRIQNYVRCVR